MWRRCWPTSRLGAGWRRSPVTADPAVLDRAVGGFGLPGQEPADVEISPKEWRGFVLSASTGRMVGIAVAAAEAGRLRLTGDQTEELLDRHRDAMLWALAIERRLLGLAEAFEAAGVRPLVLKGPALAHTMYPDPSWRVFGDLDLLVPTSSWRRAPPPPGGAGVRGGPPRPPP